MYKECIVCHQTKLSRGPKEKFQPYLAGEAAVRNAVAIDVANPLWSDGQYRYFC